LKLRTCPTVALMAPFLIMCPKQKHTVYPELNRN
jgi:hypothetical protein